MNKIKTVVTHSGSFHADDVFAVAIINYLNTDVHIIRSRDISLMENLANTSDGNVFVDVGGKYEITDNTEYLDHHMYNPALETTDRNLPFNEKNVEDILIKSTFDVLKKTWITFSINDLNKITQKVKWTNIFEMSESLFSYVNGESTSSMWKNYIVIVSSINSMISEGYINEINGKTVSDEFDKTTYSFIKNSIQAYFKFRKYSGFGLVWKHHGYEYVKSVISKIEWFEVNNEDITGLVKFIDNKLVLFIDQNDNGIQSYEGNSFDILDVIATWNSSKPNSPEQDEQFKKAMIFASEFLENMIKREFIAAKEGKKVFYDTYIKGNKVQEFEAYVPKLERFLSNEKDSETEFVIFPSDNGYKIMTIRTAGFESKKDLPSVWKDINSEWKYITDGLIFVHQSLFIAEFTTKEKLIKALSI